MVLFGIPTFVTSPPFLPLPSSRTVSRQDGRSQSRLAPHPIADLSDRARRARPHALHPPPSATACTTGQLRENASSSAIVVVDHGSRRAAANDMLHQVARMVRHRSNGVPVYSAHMELATPSIADAFAAAVSKGASHILVVPFFLSPGRHVTTDIPKLAKEAASLYSGVTYDVRPPIGTHPAIADVILERAGTGTALP